MLHHSNAQQCLVPPSFSIGRHSPLWSLPSVFSSMFADRPRKGALSLSLSFFLLFLAACVHQCPEYRRPESSSAVPCLLMPSCPTTPLPIGRCCQHRSRGRLVCVCVYVCVWPWLWLCAACALCGPRVCRRACMWGGRAGVCMRASLCMRCVISNQYRNNTLPYYVV